MAPLGAYRQFVVCRFVPSATRPGKTDKFPLDPNTGRPADAHNPAHWLTHDEAATLAHSWGPGHGVGFVFTQADPFWFLDIDECLTPAGQWSDTANALCAQFPGAAVEVSQSGRGLHIVGSGPAPEHGCKNLAHGLEFYTSGRFMALGGAAVGDASTQHPAAVAALVAQYFPPRPGGAAGGASDWTDGPSEDWRGPSDDADLLRRALQSRSAGAAFGAGASFADLWECNTDALARAYPDSARAFDASSADAALAQHLAFWTGRDCERILRLMQQSGLVRDKWGREDYLHRTIAGACARQRDVLQDKAPEPSPMAATATPAAPAREVPQVTPKTGGTFLSAEAQIAMFAGCVYVRDAHAMFCPGGHMLNAERFRVAYGGFTFAMDLANERTSRDAWEAATQSQAFRLPQADTTCFKPLEPSGVLIRDGGRVMVNTWAPVEVARAVGDVGPFLAHLAKLLPDERDRTILLSYMAACVQHQGVKFQWAPVVQGCEGNGKTLLTRCVAEAVGRRHVHWPKASKLGEKFNAWMVGKTFYAVEDIYSTAHRTEILEELKPMITGGDGLEIEGKGVDQVSADVCGNFLFNCNSQDGLRKQRNDRRYAPFFTAQQCADDLDRDGMRGDYFPRLYGWLRGGGYAIVSELLHTWPIPDEFNPATSCHRAPVTTSTEAAIEAGRGVVEQEVLDAVDQGLPGFCGGWISSLMLGHLLERIHKGGRIGPHKRREMLATMGYRPHPGLPGGRAHNPVLPDGGRSVLFIKAGHPAEGLPGAEACRAYSAAQTSQTVKT